MKKGGDGGYVGIGLKSGTKVFFAKGELGR